MYDIFFRLVFERIPSEPAHKLANWALRLTTFLSPIRAAMRRLLFPRDRRLAVRAMGIDFPSPLGLAAGFDKDATCFKSLAVLGFGYIEVGTVTAQAQEGNPKPRVWRSRRNSAVINRMGFPNPGADVFAKRLARRSQGIVGVNIGKTKRVPVEDIGHDYRAAIKKLLPVADYIVLNVSSPNTPGLRDLQAVDRLSTLVDDARHEMLDSHEVPLLIKIGPDLPNSDLDAIADRAVELELDGIVAVNTMLASNLPALEPGIPTEGGVSGAPLRARALEVLERLYERVGDRLTLISVGGIAGPEDAWDRVLAGATLIQAHTGFIYGGPLWPHRVNEGLLRFVEDAKMSSIQEAVGARTQRGAMPSPHVTAPAAEMWRAAPQSMRIT